MQVFKTLDDEPYPVEIVTVGVLPPRGKGGVPVPVAAEQMPELQSADGVPLEGQQLVAAARRLAKERGWQLATMDEDAVARLPQEAGQAPDRPPAREVSLESGARTYPRPEDQEPTQLSEAVEAAQQPPEEPTTTGGGAAKKEDE